MRETPNMPVEETVRATLIVLLDHNMLVEWPTVAETNVIIDKVRELNEPMEIDLDV